MRLTAPYTLASQTTLQQLFNTPANGAFNALAGTTYLFTCRFDLTAMSATSGTFSFGFFRDSHISNIKYTSLAVKIASIATAGSAVIVTSPLQQRHLSVQLIHWGEGTLKYRVLFQSMRRGLLYRQ